MFTFNEEYKSRDNEHYYSCPWIEHGIVFFPRKLAFCCQCGHEGGGHVLIQDNFSGGALDWQLINDTREKFRRMHREGKIHSACRGCSELKYKNWDSGNYIENLYISHWTHCNSKCIYCYERQKPEDFRGSKHYHVLPYIKEMHETGILKQGGMLFFGGGEPALLDEFEDIIYYLLDKFYWGMRVHSSGIKYIPAMARAIEESRGFIILSADAGSREVYKKIKQTDAFDILYENIRKYALNMTFKSRYHVSSKYIIIPGINDNKEEIEKWLQANYAAGLWTTVMDIEEGWYFKHKNNIPEHIFELVRCAEKRSKELHTNFELYERLKNLINDEYKKTGRRIVKTGSI